MEPLHMNYLRDLIHRLHAGDSERRIARDLNLSRTTVRKYHTWAEGQGYLRPAWRCPMRQRCKPAWVRTRVFRVRSRRSSRFGRSSSICWINTSR